ncbi:MAG: glutamate-5-semialdehyde dehydrogenase [Clostridia bacterium]|nr:glutamate-5-semialdehyde dehydrogenase [Clostridia bacterium]
MTNTQKIASAVKDAAVYVASSATEVRNAALLRAAELLDLRKEEILAANEKDMSAAKESGLAQPLVKRLSLTEDKLHSLICGLRDLVALTDPNGRIRFARKLDDGLILKCVSCPIGVIGVVFESRPEALVQIAGLCIKSGNCAILKGGSEALNSNRVLFDVMLNAAKDAGLPESCLALLESREQISELLACEGYVDLLIPRGSNSFVRYIMDNTNIPVMGHAAGVCHIYVDEFADAKKAARIVCDAKTQYPAACNAAETLLLHESAAKAFFEEYEKIRSGFPKIIIRAYGEAAKLTECEQGSDEDFGKEFSDNILALKLVSSAEEAIAHINRYGSRHTDCIVTENERVAELFFRLVDSAGVYRNCSTRFADGFRYGFGAEVGISTSKLHARGPVGLEGLVTYKYILEGDGHIVEDYASGKRTFKHEDIFE